MLSGLALCGIALSLALQCRPAYQLDLAKLAVDHPDSLIVDGVQAPADRVDGDRFGTVKSNPVRRCRRCARFVRARSSGGWLARSDARAHRQRRILRPGPAAAIREFQRIRVTSRRSARPSRRGRLVLRAGAGPAPCRALPPSPAATVRCGVRSGA
ncbi:hypothetical protein [Dactylosporangium vinaceum]|uniref:hypothetical protein n=1 Tax=Dactylosporangium vinaceum TaxID=53362 RepID=UPI001CA82129